MKHWKKEILLILLLLLFVPYFVLPTYNFPASDDYCCTAKVDELGFIDNAVFWYNNWTSRYTATSLISYPFKKGFFLWSRLFPYLLFLSLFWGLFLFFKKLVFPKLPNIDIAIATLLFLLSFVALLRSTSSAFYWAAGSLTYTLSIPLILFLVPFIQKIAFYQQSKTRQISCLVWSSVFIAVVIGTNETILPLLDFALIVAAIWGFWERKKGRFHLLILLAVALTFSTVVFVAPGNYERMNSFSAESGNFWSSVFSSFVYLKRYISEWIINGLTLFLTLAFIPFAKKRILPGSPLKNVKTVYLLLYPFVSMSLIAAMFFPAFWAMNEPPPNRAINVIYFFLLIFWFLLILCLLELYERRQYSFRFLSKFYRFLSGPKVFYILIALFLLGVVTTRNYSAAYREAFGKGAVFAEQAEQRYRYIRTQKAAGHTDIVVEPFDINLRSLKTGEIDIDKSHWVNRCLRDYFGIRSIARTQ